MPAAHPALLPALSAIVLVTAALSFSSTGASAPRPAGAEPAPVAPEPGPVGVAAATDTAVFAGGCFWGVEAVFESLEGVSDVMSGYAGGSDPSPSYRK